MSAPPGPLGGVWQGTLRLSKVPVRGGEWDWKTDDQEFRLEISGDGAKVATHPNGIWRENPRSFNVVQLDTNAVITSITTGRDKDGDWVETWTFVVTLLDSTHLETTWHRQVNNKELPRGDPNAAWDIFGYGQLEARPNGSG
jgi:hypothetical protein